MTQSGKVAGVPGRSSDVTVFRGIPYAAPPVGDLRWRAPQPPARWEGVRLADRFGPVSPQPVTPAIQALGLDMSEDCLHLNIWTGATSAEERRPVLVWIYGGGFQEGTSADPRFDGENLARKGVVVVTFNYRLGVLGFLASPELSAESGHRASGNYGLLDCVQALRWVNQNIAGFGGDPGRVTIAGQSAGAGTVNFLSMSPLATGLFQRSIAQSHARYSHDPELRYLATSYRELPAAEQHGEQYVLDRVPSAGSLQDLRSVPWPQLMPEGPVGDLAVRTGSNARPPLFRPVVDGWVLPQGYGASYAQGLQNSVAYIAGNNLDESGAMPDAAFAAVRAVAVKPWRPGMPPTHVTLEDYLESVHEKFGELAGEALSLYPASTDDEAASAYNEVVRDNARISTYLWGTQWTAHATEPVYTYFWTHRAPNAGPVRRAAHGAEIDYVFDNLDIVAQDWDDADREMARIMSGYWVNFIAGADPNGPGLPEWPQFRPGVPQVLNLDVTCEFEAVAGDEKIDFWSRFFKTEPSW